MNSNIVTEIPINDTIYTCILKHNDTISRVMLCRYQILVSQYNNSVANGEPMTGAKGVEKLVSSLNEMSKRGMIFEGISKQCPWQSG